MTIDYGTDISTPDGLDLDPLFTFVTGLEGLGQAFLRRLVTAHGSLDGDADYGHDVRQYLNDDSPDLPAISAAVTAELAKDERVESVVATVTADVEGALRITATGYASTVGPFRLTLSVDAVSSALLTETST